MYIRLRKFISQLVSDHEIGDHNLDMKVVIITWAPAVAEAWFKVSSNEFASLTEHWELIGKTVAVSHRQMS